MTDQGNVWFDYLTTAYVQTGKYEVAETYLPGKHQEQRTVQITADGVTALEYPESFAREWATFVSGDDASTKGYDPGAYGIGTSVHTRVITVPKVTPVHLLYYYSTSGTKEERILVQAPATTAGIADPEDDLVSGGAGLGLDMISTGPSRKIRNFTEYVEAFPVKGFNRYGFVLPKGVSRSKVSELHSFTGTFIDVDDASDTYTVYFEPMYINNDMPLFDMIYMQTDVTDLDSNVAGIPSRLLRWLGGITSTHVAPINRSGDPIERGGYYYDTANGIFTKHADVTLEIDGVSYTGSDAYNTGYKRQ